MLEVENSQKIKMKTVLLKYSQFCLKVAQLFQWSNIQHCSPLYLEQPRLLILHSIFFLHVVCLFILFLLISLSLSLSLSPPHPSRSDKFKLRFSTFSGVEKTGDKFFIEMEEISRRRRWMKPRFFLTFSNV